MQGGASHEWTVTAGRARMHMAGLLLFSDCEIWLTVSWCSKMNKQTPQKQGRTSLKFWGFFVLVLFCCLAFFLLPPPPFFFKANQKISSITVKSLFICQTLICCFCFCKDQMGNGSCTANQCVLLEIVKCRATIGLFSAAVKLLCDYSESIQSPPRLLGAPKRGELYWWNDYPAKRFQRTRLMTHSSFWFIGPFSVDVRFQPHVS